MYENVIYDKGGIQNQQENDKLSNKQYWHNWPFIWEKYVRYIISYTKINTNGVMKNKLKTNYNGIFYNVKSFSNQYTNQEVIKVTHKILKNI